MKTAHELAKALPMQPSKNSSEFLQIPPLPGSPPSIGALVRLWLSMIGAFGHRWVSAQGSLPVDDDGRLTVAGGIWSVGLTGLTDAQVFAGFERCASAADEWPPSLPGFKAQCHGIPSLANIRLELRAGHPSPSPFARMCWSFIDAWSYHRADGDKAERMLRDAYDLAREHVMSGGALPQPAIAAIAEQVRETTKASPEIAEKHRAEINAIFGTACDAPGVANDP